MDLKTTIELRSVQAAGKQDRFQPVHAGAHNRFTKAGYMHTGNKNRGGIATSEYFKTKGGNSRTVSVQGDGSYVKTSRTVKGNKRSRGKFDAKGMKCGGPGSGRHKEGAAAEVASTRSQHHAAMEYHEHQAALAYRSGNEKLAMAHSQAAGAHIGAKTDPPNKGAAARAASARANSMGISEDAD